jgi:hypothetical protein
VVSVLGYLSQQTTTQKMGAPRQRRATDFRHCDEKTALRGVDEDASAAYPPQGRGKEVEPWHQTQWRNAKSGANLQKH